MNNIWFLAGCAIFSAGVGYAWWIKIRVTILRQDFFALRDGLFNRAMELDALDDPAYREARRRVNAIIQFAHRWNTIMVVFLVARPVGRMPVVRSERPELQAAIDDTLNRVSQRACEFIYCDQLSGFLFTMVAMIMLGVRRARIWLRRSAEPLADMAACGCG